MPSRKPTSSQPAHKERGPHLQSRRARRKAPPNTPSGHAWWTPCTHQRATHRGKGWGLQNPPWLQRNAEAGNGIIFQQEDLCAKTSGYQLRMLKEIKGER